MHRVDAEFVGDGADWPVVMEQLNNLGLLSPQHYFDSCLLWEFGYLINNTDMHLGNLSLGITGNVFSILPAYDMCSMGFAPVRGEVKPISFAPSSINSRLDCLKGNEEALQNVQRLARDFWNRVAKDNRISDEFREYLQRGNPVELLCNRLGIEL